MNENKRNNSFITCAGKDDGVGAQLIAILSTILFAHELGIQYVHTPFRNIAHNDNNDLNFEHKWEISINIGFNELSINQIDLNEITVICVNNITQVEIKDNTLYVIPHCHEFTKINPNKYSKLLERFFYKYEKAPTKSSLYFDSAKINIAIHIRRGDVIKDDKDRYTANCFYTKIITQLSDLLNELELEHTFHLYSEGIIEEFSEFNDDNIILHLNECPFTTFHHLVSADVLVMAKSAFSYSAALFSKGIKIYLPFQHRALKDWLVVRKNACFNKDKLKKMVLQNKSL
ncbi:MAG: hypothetical protein V7K38_20680 [Nostoc sp.]|uniref:hypothetical protein n=1 Tax=Nostoc sp. TaxID=1180 RepID=UPI002FFABE57